MPVEISLPEGFDSTEELPPRLWEALATMFPVPEWEEAIYGFGLFVEQQIGAALADQMAAVILEHGYDDSLWREMTGNTLNVWETLYRGDHETSPFVRLLCMGKPGENKTTVMTFGGDICFADNYEVMKYMAQKGYDLEDCIAPEWFADGSPFHLLAQFHLDTVQDGGKHKGAQEGGYRAYQHTAQNHDQSALIFANVGQQAANGGGGVFGLSRSSGAASAGAGAAGTAALVAHRTGVLLLEGFQGTLSHCLPPFRPSGSSRSHDTPYWWPTARRGCLPP